MRLIRLTLIVVATLLILAPGGLPGPGPTFDLDRLVSEADIVVAGQIISIRDQGQTTVQVGNRTVPAKTMLAELRVDRVLKSTEDLPHSLSFQFFITETFMGWRSIAPSSYQVFFLTGSSKKPSLLSPYYPSIIAAPGTASVEGTAIERVARELGAVLSAKNASDQQKQQAIFALGSSRGSAAVRELKDALAAMEQGSKLRLPIAAALLEHNDTSTLQSAVEALLEPDQSLSPELLHNLSYAIHEGVRDKGAVPDLARLLKANDAEARRAAASALLHIGDHSCISALLGATDDPDFEVRYYSVVGLAEITGQKEWQPNMEVFRAREDEYLRHWRNWSQN